MGWFILQFESSRMRSQVQHKNLRSLHALSELAIPLTHNTSSFSYENYTGRLSAGDQSQRKSLNRKVSQSKENHDQRISQLQNRIGEMEKQLELLLMKISQIMKDSGEVQQSEKIFGLERKYQKLQYMIWEVKQLQKQNRGIADVLNSQISEHKLAVSKSLGSLKSNSRLLISTIETVFQQLLQKVEINKTDFNCQLRNVCSVLEGLRIDQSYQNTAAKEVNSGVRTREQRKSLGKQPETKQRSSLCLRNCSSASHKRRVSGSKQGLRKNLSPLY